MVLKGCEDLFVYGKNKVLGMQSLQQIIRQGIISSKLDLISDLLIVMRQVITCLRFGIKSWIHGVLWVWKDLKGFLRILGSRGSCEIILVSIIVASWKLKIVIGILVFTVLIPLIIALGMIEEYIIVIQARGLGINFNQNSFILPLFHYLFEVTNWEGGEPQGCSW